MNIDVNGLLTIAGTLAIGCVISYIAMRCWIGFWDMIIGFIKRLNPFYKKKEVKWTRIKEVMSTDDE